MEIRRKTAETIELDPRLGQFLDPAYFYEFMRNPDVVRSKDDALRGGINCVSLAHLVLKELFDYELPPELGCAELYRDQDFLIRDIDPNESRKGDLWWFGVNSGKDPLKLPLHYDDQGRLINWYESPVKHVAIHTGSYADGEPLLLHATHRNGGKNALWPVSGFSSYNKYKQFWGITRLAVDQTVRV